MYRKQVNSPERQFMDEALAENEIYVRLPQKKADGDFF